MKRLTILVDSDCILANLLGNWLKIYNQEWKDNLKVKDIISEKLQDCVLPECGKKVEKIINRKGFFLDLEPLPGAVEAIERLREAGHEVVCVTAPGDPRTAKEKIKWLRREFNFEKHDIILAHKKHLIKGDIFIDDSPAKIANYRKAWPQAKILTIAYPYNTPIVNLVDCYAESYENTAKAWQTLHTKIEEIVDG